MAIRNAAVRHLRILNSIVESTLDAVFKLYLKMRTKLPDSKPSLFIAEQKQDSICTNLPVDELQFSC